MKDTIKKSNARKFLCQNVYISTKCHYSGITSNEIEYKIQYNFCETFWNEIVWAKISILPQNITILAKFLSENFSLIEFPKADFNMPKIYIFDTFWYSFGLQFLTFSGHVTIRENCQLVNKICICEKIGNLMKILDCLAKL